MKKILLSSALLFGAIAYAGGDYIPTVEPVQQPVAAATASNFYAGMGLSAMTTYGKKQDWFSETTGQDRTGGIVGILGYQFIPNLAIEGRLGVGIFSGDYSESTNASIFLKPSYNVTEDVKVYGLLGFGWVKIDGKKGYSDIAKSTSPQFGLGASYRVKENIDIFADYSWLLHDKKAKTMLPDESSKVSHDALTVGLYYHF